MSKTGEWLADWMTEDGTIDRLPDGWDDPHALIAKVISEARAAGRAEVVAEASEAIRDMAGSLTSSEPLSDEDWAKRSADDLLSRDTVLAVLRDSKPEAGVDG